MYNLGHKAFCESSICQNIDIPLLSTLNSSKSKILVKYNKLFFIMKKSALLIL